VKEKMKKRDMWASVGLKRQSLTMKSAGIKGIYSLNEHYDIFTASSEHSNINIMQVNEITLKN